MVSEKDINSTELATMRTASGPMTVMTANGEVRTNKEATEHVKQSDLFVTVMILQETPAVLSLEKLFEEHGCTYHWKIGQNPHLIKNGKRIDGNISNSVPFVVPGISASSSQLRLHLPRHHLHHEVWKLQYQKEVEVRMKSFGETRCMNPQKPKTKIKIWNRKKSVQRDIARIA